MKARRRAPSAVASLSSRAARAAGAAALVGCGSVPDVVFAELDASLDAGSSADALSEASPGAFADVAADAPVKPGPPDPGGDGKTGNGGNPDTCPATPPSGTDACCGPAQPCIGECTKSDCKNCQCGPDLVCCSKGSTCVPLGERCPDGG